MVMDVTSSGQTVRESSRAREWPAKKMLILVVVGFVTKRVADSHAHSHFVEPNGDREPRLILIHR